MQDFKSKCAVITGGGGLLGTSMAVAFAREGMNVVVADLNGSAAADAAAQAGELGVEAFAVEVDVTELASVSDLADQAFRRFGAVDLLCNNAGLSILKPFLELTYADWQRVISVQFNGVLNGLHAFLPRMVDQAGDRHIVNTSSMSGVGLADLRPLNAPYVTAKFAVVGLTEVMAPPLAEVGIGVSVLCPGYTRANPDSVTSFPMPSAAWYKSNLLSPDAVAAEVVHGIRENRLHIFPHRAGRAEVQRRHELLMRGFDQAERTSPEVTEKTDCPPIGT